ncbi:pleckstrin homology domain-containing family A member 2 isoform X2 [Gouania willdenowi]|uniref:pleckstrin homology domain-containing family A member 2 isoform X2 n=1 Tax=Gouania willdenowi TaxID=441366 RepID=UPI001054A955|nr:pleckstrin homology domain-containing family A member 2 isoform X2 [Gouania willdenowi]
MPYVDRLNRVCGFLDIEEKENSCRFQRRYFILDTKENALLWYMDNPQVSEATTKQKPKTEFCFVINAVSRRYFLQADDEIDLRDWVAALNQASKITVPKSYSASQRPHVSAEISDGPGGRRQQAYKTEIIGGVVVHTTIPNDIEETEGRERRGHHRPGVLRCGYCVKQGNVRKSWKRRFFTLDDSAVSYFKTEMEKDPLRTIPLRDIQKVHECLVKSGDLLLRDNLFEIITGSRTFYIQTDSPEEMRGWIRDIEVKIQDFRGPPKGGSFKRSSPLYRSHNALSASRGQSRDERRPGLVKSCSVAPSWQPWSAGAPGPSCDPSLDVEDDDVFSSVPAQPSLSSSSTSSSTSSSSNSLSNPPLPPPPSSGLGLLAASAEAASGRRRHRSQPQPPSGSTFPFSLDDDGIRTTDV